MGTLKTRVNWFSQSRPSNASHDTGTTVVLRPYADLTRAQLSHLAKERGLDPSGTKDALLERLSDG